MAAMNIAAATKYNENKLSNTFSAAHMELPKLPNTTIPDGLLDPDPNSCASTPGFLNFSSNAAPSAKMLDVRFYTTPNTPPPETEIMFNPEENYQSDMQDQDALIASLMKELIHGYETRYKWNQYAYKDAAEHDHRTQKLNKLIQLCGPKIPRCEKMQDLSWAVSSAPAGEKSDGQRDDYWSKLFDRATITVAQSAFITVLENQVQTEIKRCGCAAPNYEITRLYEDLVKGHVSMDSLNNSDLNLDDYVSVRDSMEEPEEMLIARLKIYKRALSEITLHFKSLRPILIPIKRNYDALLGLRERQMHDARLHKNNIGHSERSFDVRLAQIRVEGYRLLCEAEKRCFLLLRHVDKQDGAIRTMTDILKNLENSLEDEKILKTSSEDKRKKLIMEINDLRRQTQENARILGQDAAQEVAAAEEEGSNNDEDVSTATDAMAIRNVLENTRTKLSEVQKRLTILEADYSDVIPKKDHESLKETLDEATKLYNVDNDEFETISSQVQNLKDQVDSLIADRDDLQELLADLKFKATPRPSWSKIAEYVEGGMSRWQEIYQGKTSKEIVDQVVEVLTGKKVKGSPEWIEPEGTKDSVPAYLRYEDKIRHRNFTRREAAILVHDIQQTRIEQLETIKKARENQSEDDYGTKDENTPDVLPFPDYFRSYLEERFTWPNIRAEYTYNLIDACKRLSSDSTLCTFLGILEGRMDECLIHGLRSDVGRIRNILMAKSTEGGQPMGSILTSEFPAAMREAFPQKTDEEIGLLGLVGDFIEEVTRQYNQNRMQYIYEVLHVLLSELGVSLESAERDNDPAGETDVAMTQIYQAIVSVDPQIPEEKIAAALAWIFMAEPTLPGTPVKGMLLVRYIQEQIHRNKDADSDDEDDNDMAEFERAIDEIRARNDSMFDDDAAEPVNEKAKKAALKKLKELPLKLVLQRLKGGCLFRHGEKEKPGLLGKGAKGANDVKTRSSRVEIKEAKKKN
ncbi:unnamed protein product [Allacma fusca]|uniref:Uncharacterized protein n=1 Tax=Allacma fusca TaxID=39272 RepID=A0A8J2LTA4_9HEXA|nr:unnamed protein product [Allacma fusca]